MNLNPFWTSLFLLDENTWNYITDYFEIHDTDLFCDPMIIYFVIVKFVTCGTFVKEQATNFEYIKTLKNIMEDPKLKDIVDLSSTFARR